MGRPLQNSNWVNGVAVVVFILEKWLCSILLPFLDPFRTSDMLVVMSCVIINSLALVLSLLAAKADRVSEQTTFYAIRMVALIFKRDRSPILLRGSNPELV